MSISGIKSKDLAICLQSISDYLVSLKTVKLVFSLHLYILNINVKASISDTEI